MKILTKIEAVELISDGATVGIGGFVGMCHPEELTSAIEESFLNNGRPQNLNLIYAAGQGDRGLKGINHLAHEGLVKRVIGGHWALAPKMSALALQDKIEAYNFPQGIITHLYRDAAAKRPGTISHVGLNTFVDPRISGGKMNNITTEDLIEILNINDQEWLFYKAVPIDVALIRGTYADQKGNISMEKEAGTLEMLSLAQAAHNNGGITIAQVEKVVKEDTISPWMVKIPGMLVDYVVVADPINHWQTFSEESDECLSGNIKIPYDFIPKLKLDERKVICRRATKEIKENAIVNLGIGMPEGISSVANEEGILNSMTITVESGIIGGVPAGNLNFGASYNPEAIIDQPAQFDFYDGGGLDVAFLGMAQVDKYGNVNVSKYGTAISGSGGFINITQSTQKVVFCGTFVYGGLEIEIENSSLIIKKEGSCRKFLQNVEQITFSGKYAIHHKQEIFYVTERAVFKLTPEGLMLIEIAPGVDIEKHILSQMDFMPAISSNLKEMDKNIFT
jgi:propionate CoA-transferase